MLECIKKCGAIDFLTNLKEYNSFKNESQAKEESSPRNRSPPNCNLSFQSLPFEYFSDDLQTLQSQRKYSHCRASPPYSNYHGLG
jgi:hypothetical protein